MHELDAGEIEDLDFSIKDNDNMPITDMAMIYQWSRSPMFKVIINLNVLRNKPHIVEEVYSFKNTDNCNLICIITVLNRE